MADLTVASFDQIATLLAKLATNYSNLFVDYETLFYSDTPADITVQIYNAEGELETFTIPNRAKDRQYILNGEGSPEGVVSAAKGSVYQDLTNGNLYIKQMGTDSQGWYVLVSESDLSDKIIKGDSNPEGIEVAGLGVLYVDKIKGALYVKTTSTGNTGWNLISANTSLLADVDLSNLSTEGESHFANPDLSNLTEAKLAWVDTRESVENKVTDISEDSTDEEYPTAKATFNFFSETSAGALASRNLGNLTIKGEEHFMGQPQERDCILYAPNGVATYNETVITLPAVTLYTSGGLGETEEETPNPKRLLNKVTTTSLSISLPTRFNAEVCVLFFLDKAGTEQAQLQICALSEYFRQIDEPTDTGKTYMMWFNPLKNEYKYTSNSGTAWTTYSAAEVASFSVTSEGAIDDFHPYTPMVVSTQDDLSTLKLEIYNEMYPIGSIYTTVINSTTCPIAKYVGTWELVSKGRVLQGADSSHAVGTTIEAGLPNITGAIRSDVNMEGTQCIAAASGAFWTSYGDTGREGRDWGWKNSKAWAHFDASRSSGVYGKSSTVQPPAYVVNFWKRIA